MSVVELPQSGGCACGRVRYDLQGAPLLAYACHCHGCQKRSGSAFALTLVLRSADLKITGTLEALRMSSPSGREVEHGLCPECRYRLFARASEALDFVEPSGGHAGRRQLGLSGGANLGGERHSMGRDPGGPFGTTGDVRFRETRARVGRDGSPVCIGVR